MKLGALFGVNALISLAFAAGFIFVPVELLERYGVTLNAGGLVVARLFGAALGAIGILTAAAVSAPPSEKGTRAIVVALLAGDALGAAISAQGVLKGAVNSLGWSTVAIYAVLTLGYAYFLIKKPTA